MLESNFTKLADIICEISEVYRYEGRFDDAIHFFDSIKPILELRELRNEDKAKILINFAKLRMDSKFLRDLNYDDEMNMLKEAQILAEKSNERSMQADAIDLSGKCIYRSRIFKGDFEEALNYYLKALNLRTEINDKLGLSNSYFNIGLYHENKKDSDENDKQKAFEYYQKGLNIAVEGNFKLEQSYFYRHLAFFYEFHENDLDKGLEYHKKSAELREAIEFKFSLQFSYFEIAFVYFLRKDFENAKVYFEKAYFAAQNVERTEAFKILMFRRGGAIVKEMDLESAIKYYDLIKLAAKKVKDLEGIKEIELKVKDLSKKG